MPELAPTAVVLLAGGAYLVGLRRLWGTAGPGRLVRPLQAWAYLGGLAAAALAQAVPADRTLTLHMVSHVLLLGVAAPLLAVGAPLPTLLWALPGPVRRRLVPGWQRLARSHSGGGRVTWTAGALVAHVTATWAWHAPAAYQAAVGDGLLHALEHATFVATTVVLWWAIAGTRRREAYGAGVGAVFVGALSATALGAFMTLAPRPWYGTYAAATTAALADQQLAGVVMWGFGGAVALVGAATLFATWLATAERAAPEPPWVPAGVAGGEPGR